MSFIFIFFGYLGIRIRALTHADSELSDLAFDLLACGAAVLFPRLAFTVIQGSLLLIALKKMLLESVIFLLFFFVPGVSHLLSFR